MALKSGLGFRGLKVVKLWRLRVFLSVRFGGSDFKGLDTRSFQPDTRALSCSDSGTLVIFSCGFGVPMQQEWPAKVSVNGYWGAFTIKA